jgi:tagatose-1,6-bisphosphate aldolase non-catalytic subunit AgaZ/GatZ
VGRERDILEGLGGHFVGPGLTLRCRSVAAREALGLLFECSMITDNLYTTRLRMRMDRVMNKAMMGEDMYFSSSWMNEHKHAYYILV